MTTNLVLTVIGDDKPGLVEALSQAIANNSGNWLESSMSHLAGKFAGILRVSVADAEADNREQPHRAREIGRRRIAGAVALRDGKPRQKRGSEAELRADI